MVVTMTNSQLFAYAVGLKNFQSIDSLQVPMELNWKVGINFDAMQKYAAKYEEELRDIFQKYGEKKLDENGQEIFSETAESAKRVTELNNIEISVDIQTIRYDLLEEKKIELSPLHFSWIKFMISKE